MTITTVQCDECKRTKGEGNRWHKAYTLSHGYYDRGSLVLGSHSHDAALNNLDLCSEACVIAQVNRFISQSVATEILTEDDAPF